MTAQVIAITADELEALHGAGPLAFTCYLHLRAWMDYGTGITGRSRPISLAMLRTYCETHTPRGAGVQITAPSEKEIRTALARLQRAGLLRRLAGDRLSFALPRAAVASARPNQTGHGAGAEQSTAPGTTKPAPVKAFRPEPGTDRNSIEEAEEANRAHIMNHVSLSSTCALVQFLHLQDIPTAGRETTLKRWRAEGITAEGLQKAVAVARSVRAKVGSTQPVNVGLLDRILSSPPPRATVPRIGADLVAIGTAQGYPPRPGESWEAYRLRLAAHDGRSVTRRAPCA